MSTGPEHAATGCGPDTATMHCPKGISQQPGVRKSPFPGDNFMSVQHNTLAGARFM